MHAVRKSDAALLNMGRGTVPSIGELGDYYWLPGGVEPTVVEQIVEGVPPRWVYTSLRPNRMATLAEIAQIESIERRWRVVEADQVREMDSNEKAILAVDELPAVKATAVATALAHRGTLLAAGVTLATHGASWATDQESRSEWREIDETASLDLPIALDGASYQALGTTAFNNQRNAYFAGIRSIRRDFRGVLKTINGAANAVAVAAALAAYTGA